MTTLWVNVSEPSDDATGIHRYQITWQADPGAVLIQLQSATGAIIRHVIPPSTIESISSSTTRASGHTVCINTTLFLDSIVLPLPSAHDALLCHWNIVDTLSKSR
jgi:hypothetical protein